MIYTFFLAEFPSSYFANQAFELLMYPTNFFSKYQIIIEMNPLSNLQRHLKHPVSRP